MAQTTCPDCGNQYADDAPYCPNCGRPNPARAAGGASTGTPGTGGNTPPETPATGSATYTAGTGGPSGGAYSAGTGQAGPSGGAYSAGTGQAGSTGGAYSAGTGEAPSGGYGAPGGGYTGGQQGGYGGGAAGGGYGGGQGGYGGGAGGGGYQQGGAGYGGGQPPQNIPNYLVQAILATLCCCLPLGIVSIVYATQVNTKRDSGDIAGAWAASANAKKWSYIAIGLGVVGWIIWGLVYGFAMIAAIAGSAGQPT